MLLIIHVPMAIAWCSHDDAEVEGICTLQEALSRHSTTLVIIAESERVVHVSWVHIWQGHTFLISWFGTQAFELSFEIEHEWPDPWKCLQTFKTCLNTGLLVQACYRWIFVACILGYLLEQIITRSSSCVRQQKLRPDGWLTRKEPLAYGTGTCVWLLRG